MAYLTRAEIVGRKVVGIVQVVEARKFANIGWCFYRLDCGIVVSLPHDPSEGIVAEEPPPEAEPIAHPLLDRVYGKTIAEVYRSENSDESPYLALENEYLVNDVIGAWPGTALEGVWIYHPGEIDRSILRPFWDVISCDKSTP